jgi:hypothetical protein
MWQSFAGCGDASCYGKFKVTTTATKFIDIGDRTPPRRLYSVATKDRLEFYYGEANKMKKAFTMISSQNNYSFEIDDTVCKVYLDGQDTEILHGHKIRKKNLSDLHVIFDSKIKTKAITHVVAARHIKPHAPAQAAVFLPTDFGDLVEGSNIEVRMMNINHSTNLNPNHLTTGEYYVNITITEDTFDLYDADFLRVHTDTRGPAIAFYGKCLQVTDEDYKPYFDHEAQGIIVYGPDRRTYGMPQPQPFRPSAPQNAHHPGPSAIIKHGAQAPDFSAMPSLGAQAPPDSAADPLAVKPPKRKKIKFSLQADSGDVE